MDLRLDIERRKKCPAHDRDSNQDLGGDVGDSPDSSRDGSLEKLSQTSERSKYVRPPCASYLPMCSSNLRLPRRPSTTLFLQ